MSRPRLIETQKFGGCRDRDPLGLIKRCRDQDSLLTAPNTLYALDTLDVNNALYALFTLDELEILDPLVPISSLSGSECVAVLVEIKAFSLLSFFEVGFIAFQNIC